MKKLIFTLLIAFFASSLAVNAQNSSKLSYNSLNTTQKQQLLKAKTKLAQATTAEEKAELQELITGIEQKIQAHKNNIAQRTSANKSNKSSKLNYPAVNKPVLKKAEIKQNQKEDLKAKALRMNREFAEKGIPYKAVITNVAGKNYVEMVELPQQNGANPIESNK